MTTTAIEAVESAVQTMTQEVAGRLQENLGNRLTPELANGLIVSMRAIAAELVKAVPPVETETASAD